MSTASTMLFIASPLPMSSTRPTKKEMKLAPGLGGD